MLQIRSKLFTPLNVGAFDLKHRLVVDWGRGIPAPILADGQAVEGEIHLSGGLAIHDPGPLIWQGESGALPGLRAAWEKLIAREKAAGQSVVARLQADVDSPIADGDGKVIRLAPRDVGQIIDAYVHAARLAQVSGFDGIELDGTGDSGAHLIHASQKGAASVGAGVSVHHRALFFAELAEALAGVFGSDRIGVRLSLFAPDESENVLEDERALALGALNDLEIAYIHLANSEPVRQAASSLLRLSPEAQQSRAAFLGILISSGQRNLVDAVDLVESRWADAICFPASVLDRRFLNQLRRAWLCAAGS